jgi:hypothetical protein
MAALNVGGVPVQQLDGALFWQAGLAVDADGCPTAYAPLGSHLAALDDLACAGHPGRWWGLVTDTGRPDGTPIIQRSDDPAPGFYVSTTALVDPSHPLRDPRRYIDSLHIPYLSIPPELETAGARLGDVAMVINRSTGASSPVILADIGPRRKIGEGSIALATAIGLNSSPRHGGTASGVVCILFTGSGRGWPRTSIGSAFAVKSVGCSKTGTSPPEGRECCSDRAVGVCQGIAWSAADNQARFQSYLLAEDFGHIRVDLLHATADD